MKILWITEGYAPNRNANGNCVYLVAKAMQQQGHDVAILTKALGPFAAQEAKAIDENETMPLFWYRYDCDMQREQIAALMQKNFFLGVQSFAAATIGKLFFLFSRSNPPGFWHTQVIARGIQRTVKEYAPDAILAACFPLETAVACANLTQKKKFLCPFFVYQLDSYVDNYTLPQALRSAREKRMRAVYRQAQGIFAHPLLQPEIAATEEHALEKTAFVEFPTLVLPQETAQNVAANSYYIKDGINCAYFGSLYAKIRNPEPMLTLFEALDETVHLHIFGQAQDVNLEPWKKRLKGRLHLHGEVPQAECFALMQQADVLVNLGNAVANQLPSKIFQYFAAGRPIVNLVLNADCATVPYMKKHPKVITLSGRVNEDIDALQSFLQENYKDESIRFAAIKSIYVEATPVFVAQKIIDVIEKAFF